jgi:hypothetical protein
MSTAGGVFISYRREESGPIAGRLADRLTGRFGAEQVFMDVQAIEPGTDFAHAIFRAVDACAVLVAVIGPGWLSAADGRGNRRLDNPNDFVRLEIAAALWRGVRVIPVLVEDAVMPREEDLPEGLADLGRLQALRVRHESFHSDAGGLIEAIEHGLALAPAAAPGETKGARSAGRDELARAAQLLDDAEDIAHSIPVRDKSSQARAFCAIAEAAAVSDPGRAARVVGDAERIASSISDLAKRGHAESSLVATVAMTDPDLAERIANSASGLHYREYLLSKVAVAVAVTDPERAERIADSMTLPSTRAEVMSDVAGAVAATDRSRAARLIGDAERIARSISKSWKRDEMYRLTKAAAAVDLGSAERIANSITETVMRERALSIVAGAVAVTDPDRAERIATSIRNGSAKADALSNVAGAVAVTDPDRAERIATSITDKSAKAIALSGIAKALTA